MVPSRPRAAAAWQRRAMLCMSSSTIVVIAAALLCASTARKGAPRPPRIRRARHNFARITQYLSEGDFTRCFRMPRTAFYKLVAMLKPDLMRNASMAKRSSGGVIEPASRLAIFLRMLAGASYLDLQLSFCVARSTIYGIFTDTLSAVLTIMPNLVVPVADEIRLRDLSEGFRTSRMPHSALFGCIAALDGIALPIIKPLDKYFPRHHFTRKGFYALPVQAMCDSEYRFLFMSARCVGSTHDSLAWACSSLGSQLMDGTKTLDPYWIAGDAAYVCSNFLLTPYSKSQIRDPEFGARRDAFNFYQSSLRIHIEQAFGMLVARFGILWKPVRFTLPFVPRILSACMRIHNFCINEGVAPISSTQEAASVSEAEAAFEAWWRNVEYVRDSDQTQQGRRTDLEPGDKRDGLANRLHSLGLFRPN
jgi:DDE superfamily endonuclease/Villin headpiece domain